jgi:hypothetical protein
VPVLLIFMWRCRITKWATLKKRYTGMCSIRYSMYAGVPFSKGNRKYTAKSPRFLCSSIDGLFILNDVVFLQIWSSSSPALISSNGSEWFPHGTNMKSLTHIWLEFLK